MGVRTELLLAGDPAMPTFAAQVERAGLSPVQIEHEIDWIAASDHGRENTAGIVALYQDDQLAGYMPLRYRRDGLVVRVAGKKLGRLPCRNLQLFGPGVVCRTDDLIAEALSAIGALPWPLDALNLWDMPIDCPLWRAIDAGQASGFHRIERNRQQRHVIELPDSMDRYIERFSRKSRGNLRRQAAQLEQAHGPLWLRTYRTPEEVLALLESVAPLFSRTYHHRVLGENLTGTNRRLVTNLTRAAERGWLRSYVLFAGDRPAAYLIGHLVRRRLSYESPGYDPDLAAQSPGLLLLLRIVEDLITARAADLIDLGPGEADYKQRFATGSSLEVSALLVRRTPYARTVGALYEGVTRASRLGGRFLDRHHAKARVKSWLHRGRRGHQRSGGALQSPTLSG